MTSGIVAHRHALALRSDGLDQQLAGRDAGGLGQGRDERIAWADVDRGTRARGRSDGGRRLDRRLGTRGCRGLTTCGHQRGRGEDREEETHRPWDAVAGRTVTEGHGPTQRATSRDGAGWKSGAEERPSAEDVQDGVRSTECRRALERPARMVRTEAHREVDVGLGRDAVAGGAVRLVDDRDGDAAGDRVAVDSVVGARRCARIPAQARLGVPRRRSGRSPRPVLRPSRPSATSRSWIGEGRNRSASGSPAATDPAYTPRAAARLMSMPTRSMSSNGPIG